MIISVSDASFNYDWPQKDLSKYNSSSGSIAVLVPEQSLTVE